MRGAQPERLRVAEGWYWSMTCPIQECCPAEGRPLSTDYAVAAEFVALGVSKVASREDLDAIFTPVPDDVRLAEFIGAAERAVLSETLAGCSATHANSDKWALFVAARREGRPAVDARSELGLRPRRWDNHQVHSPDGSDC